MRIAAIGCGGHATNNVWPNFAPQGLQLTAVAARHMDRAEAAAARFGGQPFDDAAKLLDTVEVDAAVVIVPPDQYAPVVRLCIERGMPVFTDKPGAGSADEAAALADEAAAAGVPIMVGYQKRFGSAVRQAKSIIDGDGFGPLTLGSFKWSMGAMGGGGKVSLRDWLFENPVHHFDLARYLVGELADVKVNVQQVQGEFALAIGATAVDSGAAVSLRVCTTGSWFQHNESAEVFGFGQSVLVDNIDTCIHRPASRPELVWRPNYTVPIPINSSATTMGFGTELAEFKAMVTEAGPNPSDIASAAATLRLTAEIAKQAGDS
jgi:predicted dehydrogenase